MVLGVCNLPVSKLHKLLEALLNRAIVRIYTLLIMINLLFSNKCNLPAAPGVYLVYAGSELLYVGGSSNLKQRFSKRHKYQARFIDHGADRIGYLVTSEFKRLESELIINHQPKLNKYGLWTIHHGPWWFQLSLAI